MDTPARFTLQMQQEYISRYQLGERLVQFGWLPSIPPDLGEDFIVRVYFQGRTYGENFYIQEKSITNLLERRKGDYLVYPFKIKDLQKYWENFNVPVVLVVWDIKLREGRWALVNTVISDLDRRNPKWRNNKSKVHVYIPWNNTTDDAGLIRLRQSIGQHFYPLIAKGRSVEGKITFSFPNTEEGKTKQKALEHYFQEGEPITLSGEFIQDLGFPEWWMRWFGDYDAKKARFTLSPPAHPKTFPTHLTVINTNGETASIPVVELKMIKAGSEVIHLSNEHQSLPLHLHIIFRSPQKYETATISGRLSIPGHNVSLIRDALRFLQAIASGGRLQLTFSTLDNLKDTILIPSQPDESPPHEYLQLFDHLCTIQDKTGQFLQVPVDGFTQTDIQAIYELTDIIKKGKTTGKVKSTIGEFKGQALELILDVHRQNKPIRLNITSEKSWVELFGQAIQTGPMTRHVAGMLKMPVSKLEEAVAKLGRDEYLSLKFVDCEIIEIFPDWFKREARRLSRLLIENFAVESVYLFGSLVWRDFHTPDTDIDLAVGGLPTEQYLEAVDYLDRESNFPVDLVDLSKVPDSLRQRILTEGQLLGEQEPTIALG